MGRTYYDDPIKNERFKRVYEKRMYCPHGVPNYARCSRCITFHRNIQYEEYRRGKTFRFRPEAFDSEEGCFETEDCMDKAEFYTLRRSNSEEQLRKEYHKLARINHPDKGGHTNVFQRLNNLYYELRKRYY